MVCEMQSLPLNFPAEFITHFPTLGVIDAFWRSDGLGKFIVLLLCALSGMLWYYTQRKFREIRRAKYSSGQFLRAFRREAHPLNLYLQRIRFEDSPLYQVYKEGCTALADEVAGVGRNPDDLFVSGVSGLPSQVSEHRLKSVNNAIDRSITQQALMLQDKMNALATIISLAPFLGLFGTVWGVMLSFNKMAGSGSVLLGEVAPGISSALLTTVAGLVVAIPAIAVYNWFGDEIRKLIVEMDHFAQEMMTAIERNFTRGR